MVGQGAASSSSRSMVVPITVAVVAGGAVAVAAALISRRIRERRQFERDSVLFDIMQIKESLASVRRDVDELKQIAGAATSRPDTEAARDLRTAELSRSVSQDVNQTHATVEKVLRRFREDDEANVSLPRVLETPVPLATSTPLKAESANGGLSRVTSASTVSSNDDYMDAVESLDDGVDALNASFASSGGNTLRAPSRASGSVDMWSQETRELSAKEDFEKVDSLLADERGEEAYEELKAQYDASEEARKNPEVLWRLAKACHQIAGTLDSKDPKKKERLFEGRKFSQEAHALEPTSFFVLKWAAIMSGSSTDYMGTKEKIEEGYRFKEYLDKALTIDAKEFSLLHMRGRFAFSVANLSWIERKVASTLFAAPPTATIDEALLDFLAANDSRPDWLENQVYIAKCYLAKSEKDKAVAFLREAIKEAPNDTEKELHAEASTLLKKHAK